MIETTTNKVVYVVADNPVFAFPIPFFAPSDIHCYLYDGNAETELARGVDFEVEVKTDYSHGANVTLLGTLVPGNKLAIVREMTMTQDVNLPEYGKIPTTALESLLDKFMMICQQLREVLARTLTFPPTTDEALTPNQLAEALRDSVVSAQTALSDTLIAKDAASTYSVNASGAMVRAETAAVGASTYSVNASGAMVRAETAAIGVSTYAENASGAMVAAQGFANSAQTNCNNASTYANNAASYRRNASAYNASAGAHEAGASGAEVRASAAMERAIVAEGGMVIVEDSTTVGSAHIPVLSGGTSYRFAHPLASLTIDNADAHPAECAATFLALGTMNGGKHVVCSAYGPLGGTIEPYRYHYLTIRDGVVLAHPVSHQVRVVEGVSGVQIYSGAVASRVSGGAWMSGLILSGMHWRADVRDGGILAAVSLGYGAKTSVYSGGIVLDAQMDAGTFMYLCGGRAYFHAIPYISGGLTVSSGGMAYGARIDGNAASMTVSSGGAASCVVLSAGTLTVLSGGTAHEVDNRGGTVVSSAGADVTYVTNN